VLGLIPQKDKSMYTTVLPVWGAALLLVVGCWGFGQLLVTSQKTLVHLLAGWCAFLLLCAVAWVVGLSAHAMRPVFWIFFATGWVNLIRGRRWSGLVTAAFCTGTMTFFLCAPCVLWPGLLAYGANGTDMWGYICTAEWLYSHSIRDLPDVGHVALRFNWVWQVLGTRERPMIYESLACLGSSTGLSPLQAYDMYPVALLSTLAIGISWEPGVFGLKRWYLAVIPAVLMAYHPLLILHWIAGFFGGMIVGMFAGLAFAAVVAAEEGRPRSEVLAFGALMMIYCAGLYTGQFLLLGPIVLGVPAAASGVLIVWRKGWRGLLNFRPNWRVVAVVAVAIALTIETLALSGDEVGSSPGGSELSRRVVGQFLGLFGATNPYSWMEYAPLYWRDIDPLHNPGGTLAGLGLLILLGLVAWRRWRTVQDIRVPVLVALCLGCLWQMGRDQHIMAKGMPVFGVALLFVLAAVSGELRHWSLGLAAAIICCMPFVRSAPAFWEMEHGPYISCTEENMVDLDDADFWRIVAYLYFREDQDVGRNVINWRTPKHRMTFFALTCYLPDSVRKELTLKYHVPASWSER
jgi:hypothetical protein